MFQLVEDGAEEAKNFDKFRSLPLSLGIELMLSDRLLLGPIRRSLEHIVGPVNLGVLG